MDRQRCCWLSWRRWDAHLNPFPANLGEVLGRPTILPVPGFAVRAALGLPADDAAPPTDAAPDRADEPPPAATVHDE